MAARTIPARRLDASRAGSRVERRHHALGEEPDRAQNLGLLHARPLDAEDEAVDAERLRVALELADGVVRIADDEAIGHQLLEAQVEAVALGQRLVLSPRRVSLVLGLEEGPAL